MLNRHFQQWVKHPDEELNVFWNQWLAADPTRKTIADQARKIILSIDFPDNLTQSEISQEWGKMEALINQPQDKEKVNKRKSISFTYYWRVAAACIVLLVSVALLYQKNKKPAMPAVYATGYGETKEVALPDGSTVVLNANSKLYYDAGWKKDQPREVWLEGEAFFSVVHQHNNLKFLVRTKDSSLVEVLGTTFTVHKRQKSTRVVLNTGKVHMQQVYNGHTSQVVMQPGELAEWSPSAQRIVKKPVNTKGYLAFKEGKFIFDNTPVKEIIDLLRDTHGLQVRVVNPQLLGKEFTGTFPLNNMGLLMQALSRTYDLRIRKEGNQLFLEPKSSVPD